MVIIDTMKTEFKIDTKHFLVMVKASDSNDLSDLVEVINAYQSDDEFRDGMNVIYDLRNGHFDFSGDDMHKVVKFLRENKSQKPYKLALVISKDQHFGQGRMFSAYAEDLPCEFELFRDMPTCLHWINFS